MLNQYKFIGVNYIIDDVDNMLSIEELSKLKKIEERKAKREAAKLKKINLVKEQELELSNSIINEPIEQTIEKISIENENLIVGDTELETPISNIADTNFDEIPSEIAVKTNLLTVSPNPFKDFVRISDVKDVVSISIVDLSGRLVKTVKPAREINLGDLQTGMYLINLKMKDGTVQTVKAIKK